MEKYLRKMNMRGITPLCPSTYLFIYPPTYLFIHPLLYPFIHPSITHPFIHPSTIHPFIHLSTTQPCIHSLVHRHIHSFVSPSIHLSIHHSPSTHNALGHSRHFHQGPHKTKKQRVRVMSLKNKKGMCKENVQRWGPHWALGEGRAGEGV